MNNANEHMNAEKERNLIRKEYSFSVDDNLIRTIAMTSADIFVVVDIESKEILFQSRTISEELGYPKNPSHDLFRLMHPDDIQPMKDHIDRMKTAVKGEVREIEYRLRASDNTYHVFRDRNTVFKWNKSGEPQEKLGIVQDISKANKAREEIKNLNRMLVLKNRELAAANSELATFNETAAKDYAQTLKNLYTNLEFVAMNDGNRLPEKIRNNIRNAQSSIQKLKLLTDDLIAFSKVIPTDIDMSSVSLNDIISDVVSDIMEMHPDITPAVKVEQLPDVFGYPDLLSVLFFELISSILKFSGMKSEVVISCKQIEGDALLFTEMLDIGYFQVKVWASHFTIDNSDSEKIFSLFHMLKDRKYKGTGMSLTVCRKIMDLHQGFINVIRNGDGADFSCFFPVKTFSNSIFE